MPATEAQIARINELSQLARTAWFSLLGYLVFVGITLLGVKDADFFVPSRQTDLPLVNVAIPTASFFWTAPILGAALYTYLHLFLIKLWDAHAEARTTDADETHHWLVNDFVLLRQRDPTTRARPLSWLVTPITFLLVWAAAPIVLAYAWWRSMPAHNEWLTLLIAACLWLTLVVGVASWRRAENRLGRRSSDHWSRGSAVPTAGLLAYMLISASWLRTEGGLDAYADGFWTLDDVTLPIPADTPVLRWFTSRSLLLPLARTDLGGEELVALPDGWRTPETARSAFRETWCQREGLDMDVCGQPVALNDDAPATDVAERQAWCAGRALAAGACMKHFEDLESRFRDAWGEERASSIENLPQLNLHGRDLRRADAAGASLVGADLSEARLEGADLTEANMEGVNLSGTEMERADLSEARMNGADLTRARLRNAILFNTRLEGGILWGASMERAGLVSAHLEAAHLGGARLTGANLYGAHLKGATLSNAKLDGTNLQWADLRQAVLDDATMDAALLQFADLRAEFGFANLSQSQLEGAIGNERTLLPNFESRDTDRLSMFGPVGTGRPQTSTTSSLWPRALVLLKPTLPPATPSSFAVLTTLPVPPVSPCRSTPVTRAATRCPSRVKPSLSRTRLAYVRCTPGARVVPPVCHPVNLSESTGSRVPLTAPRPPRTALPSSGPPPAGSSGT